MVSEFRRNSVHHPERGSLTPASFYLRQRTSPRFVATEISSRTSSRDCTQPLCQFASTTRDARDKSRVSIAKPLISFDNGGRGCGNRTPTPTHSPHSAHSPSPILFPRISRRFPLPLSSRSLISIHQRLPIYTLGTKPKDILNI